MTRIFLAILMMLVIALVTSLLMWHEYRSIRVRYDCKALIADWHPDVPKHLVEECKRRIKEK